MPFALVVIGLVLIVTGLRDTYVQLGQQLQSDGVPFTKWALAIFAVGALGYIPELRRFSHWFLALIMIAIILAQRGFFTKFQAAINAGPIAPAGTQGTTGAGSPSMVSGGLSDFINQGAASLGAPSWLTQPIGKTLNDLWGRLGSSPSQPGSETGTNPVTGQ